MRIWEIYPRLCKAVYDDHIAFGMGGTGHDFDHPLRTGQIGLIIAEDERTAQLAGGAGLCHNADRLWQHKLGIGRKGDVPPELVVDTVTRWLAVESFRDGEGDTIIDAILKHSEINKSDDSAVLVTLRDADRITCSMAQDIMEAAQFHRDLPVLDPQWLVSDPEAHSYKNPKSVLRGLECRYDWLNEKSPVCVRLPKAKKLMERRVEFIRRYIEEVIDQRREIELVPYPSFD